MLRQNEIIVEAEVHQPDHEQTKAHSSDFVNGYTNSETQKEKTQSVEQQSYVGPEWFREDSDHEDDHKFADEQFVSNILKENEMLLKNLKNPENLPTGLPETRTYDQENLETSEPASDKGIMEDHKRNLYCLEAVLGLFCFGTFLLYETCFVSTETLSTVLLITITVIFSVFHSPWIGQN